MRWLRLLATVGVLVPAAAHTQGTPAGPAAQRFRDVSISPDGKYVAWVGPLPASTAAHRGLVIVDLARGVKAAISVPIPGAIPASAQGLSWSSDGRSLVFLAADSSDGVPTVYVAHPTGAAAQLVAKVPGNVQSPELSPDGSHVAILYSAPDEEAQGPTAAAPRDTGVIDNFVDRQHLALIDVNGGALHVITPPDLYVFEIRWAPDGSELAATVVEGSGNNNWYDARLVAITPSGGMREIAHPRTQMGVPRWSTDGSQIAYIGGLMSDESVIGGDVYVVSARGGEPRDVTPGMALSAATLTWTGPQTIMIAAFDRAGNTLATVDVATGTISPQLTTEDALSDGSGFLPGGTATRDGRIVAVARESHAKPPEVWVGPAAHLAQLTHSNDGVLPAWGTSTHVSWHDDSLSVDGILIAPRETTPGQRYPMVVSVHGGPAWAWRQTWMSARSLEARLSQEGYFVFLPNPRGSYGHGEGFTRANIKDFGYGDLRDILSGIDSVARTFPVDTQRLGITGGSYGGYMSMWAVTQTTRFRASVPVAGLANWLSYAGENGINRWMLAYFGDKTVYEDPAVYVRSAPITFIDRVRTPSLIVAGERDVECPAPQSFEYWRGLQHVGTQAELIIYADEGHGIRQPAHARDLLERTIAWFDKYLAPGARYLSS